MRIPDSLVPLVDYGIVQDVVRPLMSGKEAEVFIVVSGGKYCVAKVYKEAQNRTFKHRAEYTEGRKVRNSRDQRAIANRSKHGRAQDEAAWRSTEVDMIHRLHAAGVRVPVPYAFIDGVLVMELILDADGNPAPRLAELAFDAAGAEAMFDRLMREVQRMLCAGVVHGDFSDFNVLVSADGPVVIDFPQSVDTAHNTNARKLLLRDVDNLHRFLAQFAPHARRLPYAEEMWELFQQNALTPDTRLTGRYRPSERRANTHAVLELIQDANYDERKRRDSLGMRGGPPGGAAPQGHAGQAGQGRGGYQGRQEHRPSQPREGSRSGPSPSHGQQPRRGPPPPHAGSHSNSNSHSNPPPPNATGQGRPEPGRPEPARNGSWNPPRNGGPRNGSAPGRQGSGPSRHGHPGGGGGALPNAPNANGGAPPHASQGGRGGRTHAPERPRDEGRPVEVIVARRPLAPR
jgi:RIO kinase 1